MEQASVVARLDQAARSKASASLIFRARIALLLVGAFAVVLAVNSSASARETMLTWTLGIGGLTAGLSLYLNWRHKVFALAAFCFLFVACNLVSRDHPHSQTILGWIAAHSLSLLFLYYGFGAVVIARRYALVNSVRYVDERKQIDNSLRTTRDSTDGSLIEFPSGNFWKGYWTYRIANLGPGWMLAQFKRGKDRLWSCRVYPQEGLTITQLQSGKWRIELTSEKEKKCFNEVELTRVPKIPRQA